MVTADEIITSLLDELRAAEERIAALEAKLETYRAYLDYAPGCASCGATG